MNNEKNHINYTASDIERYLSGNMSPVEMHAIEKAALDDPLLFEAIEGYEEMEKKDWNKEISLLKQKLQAVENVPIVPVDKNSFTRWWKVAATVLAIVSCIGITYLFTNKKTGKDLIAVTNSQDSAISKVDNSQAVNEQLQRENDTEKIMAANSIAVVTPETKDKTIPGKKNANENAGKDPNMLSRSGSAVSKSIAITDSTANQAGIVFQNTSNQPAPGNSSKEIASTKKVENNQPVNDFTGQVLTAEEKPVAFAHVNVEGFVKPIYTDTAGRFKIKTTDSLVNVVVTSAGYSPKKFVLQNAVPDNKIVLQQGNASLDEITIRKQASARKKELTQTIENAETTEDDAEPLGGWLEYNNYLSNNMVLPDEVKEKNIHGEVDVFVTLKNNGDISNVKIDKPLCIACDAEAVRLIKEGPKWEVKKNKTAKAKVTVKF